MSNRATFGAGCFWGVEARFRKVVGVVDTAVGYMGGSLDHPSYEDVCTKKTGHAEVIQIRFDPKRVSYEQLLEVFWDSHDPTTLNRQGPDMGTQYRSVVFFHDARQEALANSLKTRLNSSGKFSNPIVTEIAPAMEFYRAEEYHQRYLEKRGMDSCSM